MKNKNYIIILIMAVIVTVWSVSQMTQITWAVEPATPLVSTYGIVDSTSTTANLKGTYRPYKLQIDNAYFEYGTSTSYGSQISPYRECKVTASGEVCEATGQITNLTPQQTYHVRLVVKYYDNVWKKWSLAYGEDRTFSTHIPPKATTNEATDVTSTSAVLHGTANPNGNSTDAYFRYMPYCVMCNPSGIAVGQNIGSGNSPVTLNIKVTGLTPGTRYMYRLRASNQQGGESLGEYKMFFTPSKPTVKTFDASDIKTHGATLRGTVNPSGLDTMYYFEYGETASYGIKKSQVYAGKGSDVVSASLPLTNSFSPGKLYHYRIVASNTLGVSYGEDKTFTTEKLIAPTATTGGATDITLSTATLNGVVNPHNDQTMWHFEYRKAGAEWKKTDNVGVAVANDWNITAKIFSLDADTTYSYKLVAVNGAGTTTGEEKTFKTVAVALPTVTTGGVKNITKSSATLMGTINPNDTPTSYWFWYGISPQNMYHTPGQVGLTGKNDIQVSADLISLAPNTTYYYRLSANNVKGAVQGENKTFNTAAITKAPIVITGHSRNVTASSATIGGTVNPNGMATSYYFEYGISPAFGGKVPLTPQSAGSGTSAVNVTTPLAGLNANTTYYYRLVAVNSDGTSNGANMTFKTASGMLIKVPTSPAIRK
ncbi:MAG: hypothetical protein CVU62_09370 [Deltaproteobacteria bacterium HGW-Deltaproteobacteria-2]|jgi:hypothetical protein|nr:MAG: hypothetical protein CVU62_09370 [Deltaproteobacteria bacterium HGW-Deltaproteobacteria-2]